MKRRGETAVEVYYQLHGHFPPDVPLYVEDQDSTSDDVALSGVSANHLVDLYNPKETTKMDLKGWRTVIVNGAIAVVGVLATAKWPELVPAQYAAPIVAVIGMVNLFLRSITDTVVGKK